MRRFNIIQAFLSIFTLSLYLNLATADTLKTLDDCYEAALRRSESLASQNESIIQAEERLSQARGATFPSLNLIGGYTRIDTPPGQSTAFTRPDRPEVRITASQPIFRGLREFAAIRQMKSGTEAAKEARAQAEVQLYIDVSQAFYMVSTLEQDLQEVSAEIKLNRNRVQELQERRKIGRSRNSEVLSVESAVANLVSQTEVLQGQIASARESLVFLTGFERDIALKEIDNLPEKLPAVDQYVTKINTRPDIKLREEQLQVTEAGISIARGGHLPSLDATGNYYLKRVGILENQKWDFTVLFTLPLFSGGVVQSQVRDAVSRNRQSELNLQATKRQAEQEIRSLHQTVHSDQLASEALKKSVELAEKSYREQSREYRLGLVTNLDVLQALNAVQETRRALLRAQLGAKLDFARLEAAAGIRPAKKGN